MKSSYTTTVLVKIVQLKGGTFLILIDYKDRRPIYEQIIENFQQMILCGALKPGEAMPSVRSLAMELSLNPNTIQRAYQELERDGYIYTVKGKGSFVSDNAEAVENKRAEIYEQMKAVALKGISSGMDVNELDSMWKKALEELE